MPVRTLFGRSSAVLLALLLALGVVPPTAMASASLPVRAAVTKAADATDGVPADLTAGLPIDPAGFGAGPDTDAASGGSTADGESAAPAGVEEAVRTAAADGGAVPVIIRLRDQADLAAVAERADDAATAAAEDARASLRSAGPEAERDVAERARAARAETVVTELQDTAGATQPAVLDLLAGRGATAVTPYWIFNGIAATVDAATLAALEGHPDVQSVELDEEITLEEPIEPGPGEPLLPSWSLEKIHAPDVWGEYGVRGEGVVVGIMDGGADGGHPALSASWRGTTGDPAQSWYVPTGENYPAPGDGGGHGTHVTGSIVGTAPGELTGVAPGATWIAAKIFRDSGSTTESIIHDGFQWMLAPGGDPAAAPDVVNNSWGSDAGGATTFWDDVAAWEAAGIVPIFANGNNGPAPGTVGSPGSFPHAIGIGATDVNDVVASFSSRGPAVWDGERYRKPQVSAPGAQIRSTWPRDLPDGEDGYHTISGTSMATPHATGVVALMLSANPDLSIDDVRALLEDTARTEPHMGDLPNDTYGAGIVDAFAAVTRAAYSGTIAGSVTDGDGDPLGGVTITAGGDTTTTADDGTYALPTAAGDHDVTAAAYGYVTATAQVTVAIGETTTLDPRLDTAATHAFTGTVTGPGGPVAHARVTLGGTPLDPAVTGADGGFGFDDVAAGTYTVRVTAAGHQPRTHELTLDGDARLDIALDALDQPTDPGWTQYQNNATRNGMSGDALAAETLRPSWTAAAGSAVTFASPVIAGGRVFLGSDAGRLSAYDAGTGERLWSHQTGDALRGTPAVAGDLVVTGGGLDGGLVGLDAATGQQRWAVPTPGRLTVYTAPSVVDGVVYAATGPSQDREDTVFALDAATGEQLWATDVGTSVFAGPAVGEGLAIVGNADDGELIALDAATGAVRWTLARERDYFIGGASIVDGTVFVPTTDGDGGGSLLAVDAATGTLRWEAATHGDGQGSTPAVYGDLVIAGSHGLGLVVAYDRETGDQVWQYAVSGAVSASVMVTDDGFVVGGSQLDFRIWALDASTGELAWEATAGGNVTTSPAYADGLLVSADVRGSVFAFHPTGAIRGTATGPDGPVAATVRIEETGAETTADPDTGAFELTEPPGTYTVTVASYGLSTHTERVELAAGATVTIDAALTAVETGAVGGIVHDEAGAALAGVTVTLAGTPLDPATTGDDGGYGFDEVAAGTYTVTAELPGYAPLRQRVTVAAGQTATADLTLTRYEVAVVGDDRGRILAVLEDLGFAAQATDYADVTARPGDFEVVVANGADGTEPGQEAFDAFLAATDAAGTSVVWLDQWSLGWGAINHLIDYTGDPQDAPDELSGSGRVSLLPTAEHPLTAGLPLGERTELLVTGSAWSAFSGYSGVTVAELHTDETGAAGGGIGYAPRGTGSAHVLLGSLAAAASWGVPDDDWLPPAFTVLGNAVRYAADARFGAVTGTVSDETGAPLAGVTVAAGGQDATTGDDGGYRLLLEPGDHTVRFTRPGSTPVEQNVTVTAGGTLTVDATLAGSGLGAIRGTVTSGRDGAPVADAQVAVTGTGLTTSTDAAGTYALADVPGGTYELRVSAAGHFTATAAVEVVAGQEAVADVELAPSPRVGVIGDYGGDGIVALLTAAEIAAEPIAFSDAARVGEFDLVVFNDPPDPGAATFLGFLDAMDAAQVSGLFPDDRFSSDGGVRLLRKYLGDPAGTTPISDEGLVSFAPTRPDHPLFAGLSAQPEILLADRFSAAIVGYSGTPLAHTVTETGGDRGVGAAFTARTPGSVHLLLSGLAATVLQSPAEDWTDEGRALYVNAVRWAAAPGLGSVEGTVRGADGVPVPATIGVAQTGRTVTADAAGAYVVPLEAGDYTLRISAFGYKPAEHAVTVARNGVTTLDVELTPADTGTIRGRITGEADITGPSALGDPIAGATVALLGTSLTTTTADDGTYALGLVEPGDYELEVVADGHVRTRVDVTVEIGAETAADAELRSSPSVGVLDDYQGRLAAYLTYWGYEPRALTWADTAAVGDLDLVVGNFASFSGFDPGAAGWAAFDDALNRASVPAIWLDQYGRGAFRYLSGYDGDPGAEGEGRDDGAVTASAAVPEHPLLAGLPGTFPLVEADAEYSWFDDFSGTTVATVRGDDGSGGGLAGVRHRGARAVDVLLGTLSVSSYGYPAYGTQAGLAWAPEAERLLRNALGYALDGERLGAEVRGTLTDAAGTALTGTVTVAETGETVPARSGDGSFVVPLAPGRWTLRAESFGHVTAEAPVTVAAGQVLTRPIALAARPAGTLAGTVVGPDGAAVGGARVELLGTPLATTTAADGTFTVPGVPADTWTLRVTAPGFQAAERPVTVPDGATATVDVRLRASLPIAVVKDLSASITGLLQGEGYAVEQVSGAQLAGLAERVGDFRLIVFNGTVLTSERAAFGAVADAAEAAGVSVVYAGQWGGYAIGALSGLRGDPAEVAYDFVPETVEVVPSAAHPIFAGYAPGEPIPLLVNPGGNQQYLTWSGYSGTTVGSLRAADGTALGDAFGYRFTSGTSVEILLGGLAASSYGRPGDRWTDAAADLYLNAVAWATEARQAQVTGVVTADGAPVGGATVTAAEAAVSTTTAADGAYVLGLAAGTHTIRVEAFGYAPATQTVEVPASGTVTLDVALTPLPRGSVAGVVTSGGEPVAGAVLTATGPDGWTATTGDTGAYTVDDLLEGAYTVTVTADGHLPATASVTVTADATATLDVTLEPLDVGVLGDVGGAVTGFLRSEGVAAAPLDWTVAAGSLDGYEVVVVNGGEPDRATFDGMLTAADAAETSLVFTGTWGVGQGGVRLLEAYTDRVVVGAHGYGDGPVTITGFDPAHDLFAGLSDPATLITDGGYYSALASYAGRPLASLASPVDGIAAGYDWRTARSVEVVLSASAVTGAVGPGLGWTDDGERLLLNAVDWARDATLTAPGAPSLTAPAVTVTGTVEASGAADWPSTVTVLAGGEPVATAVTAVDGSWHAAVPVAVGPNELTAVAANAAGESAASAPAAVERWEPEWNVQGSGRVRPVTLAFDGPSASGAPADAAVLVVRDATGAEVARHDLRWAGVRYLHVLSGLAGGTYTLSAELDVDGLPLLVPGPDVSLPGP
ncbi:carboxypeptidase regulatory-like domain-containing protein [Jiangella alba]|uniref:alpha-amylase n=1 Tax=Jiangella alba TaxID=561176 RepID=A0A1H5PNC1_9ACTN|nr:carboxypeptidase regulatory-like domain-containing protein [Jiangella alba]SEF15403.1 Outer membrane protein assembly factor BamB, contains PQQ-like beta-propeller repeat [Jiangella alba]